MTLGQNGRSSLFVLIIGGAIREREIEHVVAFSAAVNSGQISENYCAEWVWTAHSMHKDRVNRVKRYFEIGRI